MIFKYRGEEFKIETRPVLWRTTRYKAVAVSGNQEVEIPGCISDTPSLAEMSALLKVTFIPDIELCTEG